MTRLGGWTIERHDKVDSTNERAKHAARMGTPDHTAIVAVEQTAGRGRGSHTWASPRGGLYASLILRHLSPTVAPLLALVGAAAVRRCLSVLAPQVPTWIKWPNDVLAAAPRETRPGGKLAGVLVESSSSSAGVDWAIIGIGVNAATPVRDLPRGQSPAAVSLAEWLPDPPQPLDLLDRVLEDVNDVLESAARSRVGLVTEIETALAYRGADVTVEPATTGIRGIRGKLVGLGPGGALRILTPSGERSVEAWDVAGLRAVA